MNSLKPAHSSRFVCRLLCNLQVVPSCHLGKFPEKGSAPGPQPATLLEAWGINTLVPRRDSCSLRRPRWMRHLSRVPFLTECPAMFPRSADSSNGIRGRRGLRDLCLFTKFPVPLLVQGYIKQTSHLELFWTMEIMRI